MPQFHVLYNPLSDNGNGEINSQKLDKFYPDSSLSYENITEIKNLKEYFAQLPADDKIILCGGDGTINHFVNDTDGCEIKNEVLYFPTGTGNDFALDLGYKRECKPFPINKYITNIPIVTVKGKSYRFIDNVGYGLDGYCCEIGDKKRQQNVKKINYAAIAISGLLFYYKPTDATITVDGVKHTFHDVWLAPAMNGRYYGGGIMPTPAQKRNSGKLSVMVYHYPKRFRALFYFPSIFKGEHIKYTDCVKIFEGQQIEVEFNRPSPLQIDGETILDVTSYSARV